jgi:hypothetical protein
LSSFTLSTIPFLSKHWKKVSRPSQHCARAVRSGAMKPPSSLGLGAGGEGTEEEEEKRPMLLV